MSDDIQPLTVKHSGCLLCPFRVPAGEDDLQSGTSELAADLEPDPPVAARDHGHPLCIVHTALPPPGCVIFLLPEREPHTRRGLYPKGLGQYHVCTKERVGTSDPNRPVLLQGQVLLIEDLRLWAQSRVQESTWQRQIALEDVFEKTSVEHFRSKLPLFRADGLSVTVEAKMGGHGLAR